MLKNRQPAERKDVADIVRGSDRAVELVDLNALLDRPKRPPVAANAVDRVADLEDGLARIAQEVERLVSYLNRSAPNVSWSVPGAVVVPDGLADLTDRELDIVHRLLAGERVPAIAKSTFLSPSTVRNHLSAVYRKLGVQSQQGLIDLFRQGKDTWPTK